MKLTVVVNPFARRQTVESTHSHFDGDMDRLPEMAVEHFSNQSEGYRPGIILVRVPADGFFSSVVSLDEGSELVGAFESRRKGEAPRKQVRAKGASKIAAKQVDLVLYPTSILAESGDNTISVADGSYEIVSINASPVEGEEPIHPETLMHNHFGSDGGTDTKMSDADFAAQLRVSFAYWADKAMAG